MGLKTAFPIITKQEMMERRVLNEVARDKWGFVLMSSIEIKEDFCRIFAVFKSLVERFPSLAQLLITQGCSVDSWPS